MRILLKELAEPGRQAPRLECTARGPGRQKPWGHCEPLSQTPWGALSSKILPSAHRADLYPHLPGRKSESYKVAVNEYIHMCQFTVNGEMQCKCWREQIMQRECQHTHLIRNS